MIDVARQQDCEPSLGEAHAGTRSRRAAWLARLRRVIATPLVAFREAQRRRADRDIARLVARSGGCLSDNVERAITCRRQPLSDWAAEPPPAEAGIAPQTKENTECQKRSWSSIAMPWF